MEKLPKGITQRGDRYRVSVMVKGQRQTGTFYTLSEAVDALEHFRLGLKTTEPRAKQTGPIELQACVDLFTEHRLRSSRTELANLKFFGSLMVKFFGPYRLLDTIDDRMVTLFIDDCLEKGYSRSSVNTYHATLRSVLNFAHERGWRRLPSPKVKFMPVTKGRVRFLSDEEEFTLLDYLQKSGNEAFHDAVMFLLDTGARKGEMHSLKWTDVDVKTGRITFWHTKTNTPRTVRMTSRIKSMLRARSLANRTISPFVFHDVDKHKIYRVWWDAKQYMGLKDDKQFVIHTLRHTCCTRLLAGNVDVRTVQQWMGHARLEMTQRYAHFIPSRLEDAASVLDRMSSVLHGTESVKIN